MTKLNLSAAQEFVFIRTYSRWNDQLQRRETWDETVDRYFKFFKDRYYDKVPKTVWEKCDHRVRHMDTMPSMRALWGAGPALERNNIIGYNCCSMVFKDLQSPVELFYILMCGAGVGFSVEAKYISQMPTVETWKNLNMGVHVVEDSREGWANALKTGIQTWFAGNDIDFDYSKVRPRGSRLKTMGGRASGPDPLKKLLDFTRTIITNAQGRQLNSLEWLDIGNMIAEVVVVGGVRRSSEISFSDLADRSIRHAKDAPCPPHRYMSNNSTVYNGRPDMVSFLKEWAALIMSKSGERGIFNVKAAMATSPRRAIHKMGSDWEELGETLRTNPCVTKDTWVMTADGPRQVKDLINNNFVAIINDSRHIATGFWSTGLKQVFNIETKSGYSIKATSNHKMLTKTGKWVEVGNLKSGDELILDKSLNNAWTGEGTFNQGWLLGEIVGDGGYNPSKYPTYLRFWGPSAEKMKDFAVSRIKESFVTRSDFKGNLSNGIWSVGTNQLNGICKYILPETKDFTPELESKTSSNFIRGFLRGFFDSDGTVAISKKGNSVRLNQSNYNKLVVVQRMLLRLGVVSTIYPNRKPAGPKMMPNSDKELALYDCKANHELVITKESLRQFSDKVGFCEPAKANKLQKIINSAKRPVYKSKFVAIVKEIKQLEVEEVFDTSVDEVNCFNANGLIAHNCGEINLLASLGQFCNLTEVVIRANDTFDSLIEKVEAAVWLGVMQSMLTDFPFIRPSFKKACEEERLLGVSLTGQMDNPRLMTPERLEDLKEYAIKVARKASKAFGINMAAAITTGKPSGTVSQLVNCASGAHPRYAHYYIRRYRISSTDPLYKMMKSQGVKFTPENGQGPKDIAKKREELVTKYNKSERDAKVLVPDWSEDQVMTWVVEFPEAAPKDSVTRHEVTAIEQLEWYLKLKKNWCEHNQSMTVYVRENEWLKVGSWVYDHFDEISGVSFLPYDESKTVYKQAPYEEITEEEYKKMVSNYVKIDYTQLSKFEIEDNTTGAQQYACGAGGCEAS